MSELDDLLSPLGAQEQDPLSQPSVDLEPLDYESEVFQTSISALGKGNNPAFNLPEVEEVPMSITPTSPEEVGVEYGMSLQPYTYTTPDETPRALAFLQPQKFSNSKRRNNLLTFVNDPDYSEDIKNQFIKTYIDDLLKESRLGEGKRPEDERLRNERKQSYKDLALAQYHKEIKGPSTRQWGEGLRTKTAQDYLEELYEDESVAGAILPYDTKKEYATRIFQEEIASSNLTKKQKKFAFEQLNSMIAEEDVRDSTITPMSVLESFVFNTSAIKSGETNTGDVYKIVGGISNVPMGILGLAISSASSMFLEDKYYKKDERPMSPLANYNKASVQANELIDWRNSGQGSGKDPEFIMQDVMSGGNLDRNDLFIKKAAELSLRSKKITDDEGVLSVPFYSTADVIRSLNSIADNEEKIKTKIGELLLEDPKHQELSNPTGPTIYAEGTRPDLRNQVRGSDRFKAKVNQLFNLFSAVHMADDEVYEALSDYEKKYADVFKSYYPEETSSSKAAEIVQDASYYLFEAGALDSAVKPLYRAALSEMLTVLPEEQRHEAERVLSGVDLVPAAFLGGLPQGVKNRRNLFNSIAVRYAQREEDKAIAKLASEGGLGPRWRGDHLQGTPEQKTKKKEMLHQFASKAALLETIANNPDFQNTVASFYGNVGTGVSEMPYQVLLSTGAISSLLGHNLGDTLVDIGLDVDPKQFEKEALAKYEADPVMVFFDVAGVMALAGYAGRAGILRASSVKDAFGNITLNSAGDLFTAQGIRNLFREYSTSKKTNSDILNETLKSPDETVLAMSQDELAIQFDDLTEMNSRVMVSPEHTIGQYQKSLNEVQRKLVEEKSRPDPNNALIESLEYQERSLNNIIEVRYKYRKGELKGTVVADETVPVDDSIQVKVGDVSDETVRRVEESFLSKELTDEQIAGMGSKERRAFLTDQVESQLNSIDELYKSNPKQAAEDAIAGKAIADETARGYYINDYTTKSGALMMFKALVRRGVDDYRVWKYVADSVDSKYIDFTNRQLARGIAGTRELIYASGIKARTRAARGLYDETPASVISRETKKDPRIVKDEFESLAIADELAASGQENVAAYIGLNLTNEQIAGFIDDARSRNVTARSVQKMDDYYTGSYTTSFFPDDVAPEPRFERFESGPVSGVFTDYPSPIERSPLPKDIGVTDPMSFGQRIGRAATKTVFGQEGLNLLNQYRKSGQKRFIAHLATESLIRPYASLNIPGWVKNLREELLMYAFSMDNPNPSLMNVLDFFSSSKEVVGQKQFYELRLREGRRNYDIHQLEKAFDDQDSFEITPENIQRTFDEAEAANNQDLLRTFDRSEIHQTGSVLHRMSDAEIVDRRTGKSYKVTDFLERTVEAKRLLQDIVSRLRGEALNTGLEGEVGRQVHGQIEDVANSIKSRIDSGETRLNVTDIFPDIDNFKKTFETLFEKKQSTGLSPDEFLQFETAKAVIKVYESYTSKDILFNTSDIIYSPKVPISSLDNFQKQVTILANEFIKPRRDVIFDLVEQIVTGSDTARLMFRSNGLKTIVVKTDSKGVSTVVAKFPQTQKGFLDAKTYALKSGEGFSLKSFDDLSEQAYRKKRTGPRAPKTTRAFDREASDILNDMSNYISDYFDRKKTADFIEAQLSTADAGPGVTQINQHRIAENMLAIFDGGYDLLRKNGYDPILALDEAINLTKADQKRLLGRVLSNSERNFMQRITEKRFSSNDLLEMYSDYQLSFMQTASDLMNTVHQLKLQSYLRSKGQILNAAEVNAMPPFVQKQYIAVDDVVAKGEMVFPSTMSGAYINRRVATYFQRQVGLQRALRMANPLQRILGAAQQLSKGGLLMDFINSSIAVNLFAGLFVQAPFHGKLPVNPAYYPKTRNLLKKVSEGEVISDQRFLRIARTHINSDTSIKRDVIYTKGQSLFDDFVADLHEHAGVTKTVQLMNQVDAVSQGSVFNKLVSALKLDGMKAKLDRFLERIKLEDLDEPLRTDKTKSEKARKVYSDFSDNFFKVYQYPDLVQKIAYQWQLEEAGYQPSYAYQQSMTKFIDYVDLAPYLNFLRYGGSTAAGSFFSIITSDFLTFAASQVSNHFDAITNNPMRTFIFAHLARTNDFALEELLKMKMSIAEIRSKSGDPTMMFLPGYTVEKATGREYKESGDFVGGPSTYKGSRLSGVPAPAFGLPGIGLLPLIPTDPEQTVRALPQNTEDITNADIAKSFANYFTNSLGGTGQQATEEFNKRPSESRLKREAEQRLIEDDYILDESKYYRATGTAESIVRVLGTRYVPRFIRSAATILEGSKYKSQVLGEFFGVSAKPLDLASIPDFRLRPFMKEKDLKRKYDRLIDARSLGKQVDYEKMNDILQQLEQIRNKANQENYKLYKAEVDAFLYNQFELLGKVLEGKMDKKDINDYFFQMPRKR